MVRHANIFSQLLELFPRHEFHSLVRDVGTERHSKGFSSWDHFVAMLFCQLAQAKSLREISDGMASALGRLNHLGVRRAPSKSTLAYANRERSWMLFEMVFYRLSRRFQQEGIARHKLPLPGKLFSIDSTIVTLCLSLFDWPQYRSAKGAVKIHLVLDHDGYLPVFANITDGMASDLTTAHHFHFPAGSVVVVDRGYWSTLLFRRWIDNQVHFVIRDCRDAKYTVFEDRRCEGQILCDQIIEFANEDTRERYPYFLRRVTYRDPETDRVFVYLTNLLSLPGQTIADIYKERWQIELFFKAIKQNLKIKTFIGTTVNAVMCQIWTALIAMLLLKYVKLKSRRGWALSNLVALIRWNLFTYRDLWEWVNDPFQTPPGGPPWEQMSLGF